jgi:hypothetical protein
MVCMTSRDARENTMTDFCSWQGRSVQGLGSSRLLSRHLVELEWPH